MVGSSFYFFLLILNTIYIGICYVSGNLFSQYIDLSKTRLLRWDIAPFLDDRLLDLPWVGSGPGADLLGDIHTLLLRLQLGHKLGHMFAGALGLQGTCLSGSILNNCLNFVIALLGSLIK